MFVSLRQVSRAVSFVAILVAAIAVVPVAHDLHDAADNECGLCQLRQSGTAILANTPALVERLGPNVRLVSSVIALVESIDLSTAPSRAPPA